MSRCSDIAIIGSGAAGLFAAIWAARSGAGRVVALDGAKKLGAKILVAGGGRCNVTHHAVDESAYAGSTAPAIRRVLARFPVERTVEFFRELGVELKREPTGKLFPTTDDAHSVLDALLTAARNAGVELLHPWRVASIEQGSDGFVLRRAESPDAAEPDTLHARRVILATGGMSLPKTGSDGRGYELARSLGLKTTDRLFPALVPLVLRPGFWLLALSGVTVPVSLDLLSSSGKRLRRFTDSMLITHVGISGPAALDMSRYWTAARTEDQGVRLVVNWLAGGSPEELDRHLVEAKGVTILRWLDQRVQLGAGVPGHGTQGLPERLARALCEQAGVPTSAMVHAMPREQRRAIVACATATPLPVVGDRGFLFAEVTAGGVPLSELRLETLEARACPGLHLCGEVCDVDGRIGGFNFQWAWASGFVAGRGAAGTPHAAPEA